MSDLLHQRFGSPQSGNQPAPKTIASAATITPVGLLTVLTGTTNITIITPPVTGAHVLYFVSNAASVFATGGSGDGDIAAQVTLEANQLCVMVFNPATKTYTGGVMAAT